MGVEYYTDFVILPRFYVSWRLRFGIFAWSYSHL